MSKRKKEDKANYKWAKVFGWELEDVKKRLKKLEKTVKLIKDDVESIKRDSNGQKTSNS